MKRVNAFLNRSVSVQSREEPLPSPTDNRMFTHKPLDQTQSSLRLVTVSSELSLDGTIQCYISHSVLERASYVCLSYRWGAPGDRVRILVNGLPFYVQRNLFDFLDMVRIMPMTFYWIDSLCIDQTNIPERNHQVKQMGRIFSRAFLVYLWLGKLPSMAPFMTYFRNSKSKSLFSDPGTPWNTIMQTRDIVKSCIFNHEYWSRAWVTQEILLARSVMILVGRESLKFSDLVGAMTHFDHPDLSNFSDCTFAGFADVVQTPGKLRAKTLINLLDQLRDKECEIPRDRIYSLLSLCSDFQHPEVNYDQPSEDLAFDVLKRSDEPLCTCSALLVAHTLCLYEEHQRHMDDPPEHTSFIEFDVKGLRFARHAMLCNDQILSWAQYKLIGTDIFGHDLILSGLCPAFDALMDALQKYTTGRSDSDSVILEETTDEVPSLLKIMDDEHRQALLDGFGSALTITPHGINPDISTIRIALWLLVKLIPESVPLCSRVAYQKNKLRASDEVATDVYNNDLAYRSLSIDGRAAEHSPIRGADFHRIDSANPEKHQEDEEPVSRPRLRRLTVDTR
ncbi:heterokaryon incompatibility protein-domain-containing protein [Paraphoma chrysanthemicola]|uniref:Heterokaryon incompatibility protein-domain-containing protein n=1 Tax=Paraphoma chrysanthemicola TaxID=798071 RepID=A0A8K0REQ2_9PLEO|nr:heterokaryon incompatibility protein-domain-containing protein [Paraphoma chrysanthemicola]